jgi:hypothetical protein
LAEPEPSTPPAPMVAEALNADSPRPAETASEPEASRLSQNQAVA